MGLDTSKLDALPSQDLTLKTVMLMRKPSPVPWSQYLDTFCYLFLMGLSLLPNCFDSLVKLPDASSSSSCPMTDQSDPTLKRTSQCKYVVCWKLGFDLLHRGATQRSACEVHLPAACLHPSAWGGDYKDKGDWRLPNSRLSQTHEHSGAPATCGHPCWSHHSPSHLGAIAVPVWRSPWECGA